MFLESIGYTATLIDYVARQTGRSVSDIASTLGITKVFNLCHNAPMNRLLPIERIAMEVISDNYLSSVRQSDDLVVDTEYGEHITELVNAATNDRREYVDILFGLLTENN